MGCFVRGGKNGMGCFVRGDKNCMGCFVRGGKSMRDVLSGVTKNGMGCFVPGCFVLHSNSGNGYFIQLVFHNHSLLYNIHHNLHVSMENSILLLSCSFESTVSIHMHI